MHIPGKRICDLCKVELTGPYVVMSYPLAEADRDALGKAAEQDMPGAFSMFGAALRSAVPNSWRFDFCRGCADGFMPMLAELKAASVAAYFKERERRAAVPVGEADE